MEISDRLLCLFSARVEQRNGSYVVEVPERELELGDLAEGEAYRIAVLPAATGTETETDTGTGTGTETGTGTGATSGQPGPKDGPPAPPVEEGERRVVEIEDMGEQGDGITRVERGYVIIVPGTDVGERVTIEVTEVRENVSFAEVVERQGGGVA